MITLSIILYSTDIIYLFFRVYNLVGGKYSPNYPKENWNNIKKILKTSTTNVNIKDKIRDLKKWKRIPENS